MFNVVAAEAWPRTCWTAFTLQPALMSMPAKAWRRSWYTSREW
jgi:hypothetical protein